MAIIPGLKYTSFIAITATLEVWIFIGILIIMNSSSNKDSALKCFVFFLISQPLVYLIEVPFKSMGWGLFGYYKFWFVWTVLCLPMGFIGYYMKKDKWWGYLILAPMIGMTAYSYYAYLRKFFFSSPRYILISLFCACMMILYPLAIFKNKKIRITGFCISALLIIGISVASLLNPIVYSTDVMASEGKYQFDDTYSVRLEDSSIGTVEIQAFSEVYLVHGDFKKAGETKLILESSDGVKQEYLLKIEENTFKLTKP